MAMNTFPNGRCDLGSWKMTGNGRYIYQKIIIVLIQPKKARTINIRFVYEMKCISF